MKNYIHYLTFMFNDLKADAHVDTVLMCSVIYLKYNRNTI